MKESKGANLLKELLAELPKQELINHWNSVMELDLEGPTFEELFENQVKNCQKDSKAKKINI